MKRFIAFAASGYRHAHCMPTRKLQGVVVAKDASESSFPHEGQFGRSCPVAVRQRQGRRGRGQRRVRPDGKFKASVLQRDRRSDKARFRAVVASGVQQPG